MPTLQRCLRLVKPFQSTASHFPWRTSFKKGNLKFVSFKDHVEVGCWEPAFITGPQALGQTPMQAIACFFSPRISILLCTFWKAPPESPILLEIHPLDRHCPGPRPSTWSDFSSHWDQAKHGPGSMVSSEIRMNYANCGILVTNLWLLSFLVTPKARYLK